MKLPLIRSTISATLFCGALLGMQVCQAVDSMLPEVKTSHGVRYMVGGIGTDQVAAMHRVAKDYNLHLTFSEKIDNEFVPDVKVSIQDANGDEVLSVHEGGPLLYAKLPEGHYHVRATYSGQTQHQAVSLARGDRENLYFHWGPMKANVKHEPTASQHEWRKGS